MKTQLDLCQRCNSIFAANAAQFAPQMALYLLQIFWNYQFNWLLVHRYCTADATQFTHKLTCFHSNIFETIKVIYSILQFHWTWYLRGKVEVSSTWLLICPFNWILQFLLDIELCGKIEYYDTSTSFMLFTKANLRTQILIFTQKHAIARKLDCFRCAI